MSAQTFHRIDGPIARPINNSGGAAAARRLLVVALLSSLSGSLLGAQTPKVYYACYVPSSGTVYRIKEANTPSECGSTSKKGGQSQPHTEFSWTDGAGADHGALSGRADDDHTQYLLADGVRNSVNGFAVTGTLGVGSIPASGPGVRMMWYPAKAAFRAGGTTGTGFDDFDIGPYSVAMGDGVRAPGANSVAIGSHSQATGEYAVALSGGAASGRQSLAFGTSSTDGDYSIAMGFHNSASGDRSVALGSNARTNGRLGAFVYGDASTNVTIDANSDNQFVVRAARFWFGTTNNVTATTDRYIETSTGAFLSTGGTWTNSSDSSKKTGFGSVDGEAVLGKLAALPVQTWSYRSEDSTVRHMGPTAQAFRSAFSLGDSDTAIATVDADGVSLAAIQALIKRTDALTRENKALADANAGLHSQLGSLEERLRHLEAELAQLATRSASGHAQR